MTDQTPQDRLAAALDEDYKCCTVHDELAHAEDRVHVAARLLAADPTIAADMTTGAAFNANPQRFIAGWMVENGHTIAADMELGARLRDPADPLLERALYDCWNTRPEADGGKSWVFELPSEWLAARLRAALTEGEKPLAAGPPDPGES